MIVDTSAIVAILRAEPEKARFEAAVLDAERCSMSAGSWIELTIIALRRGIALEAVERYLQISGVAIEPVTVAQAELGRNAYREFGKGRHPAGLNFGDCFAYALAKSTGRPLLYKGDDFIHTDIAPAV